MTSKKEKKKKKEKKGGGGGGGGEEDEKEYGVIFVSFYLENVYIINTQITLKGTIGYVKQTQSRCW